MEIGFLIREIAQDWPAYRSKGIVNKSDPVYKNVVEDFPGALRPIIEEYTNIEVQGSTGVGNITAAPWIALFDRRLTSSATAGTTSSIFSQSTCRVSRCLWPLERRNSRTNLVGPLNRFPACGLRLRVFRRCSTT